MSALEKCPKCGAGSFDKWTTGHQFECNTLVLSNGLTLDGLICMKAQRDQLAERVKRLEEVGDAMAMAEGCRCDDGIICKCCFERANAWRAVKGQR